MAYITGVVPQFNQISGLFSMNSLYVLLSAWAIIIAGSFLMRTFKLPQILKGTEGKLTSLIIYGAIPFYLIFVGFSVQGFSLMTALGLLVFTFPVAWIAGWVGSKFRLSF